MEKESQLLTGLNELCNINYLHNVKMGFYEKDVNIGEKLMLIVSELGEAMEAHRKNVMCDKSIKLDTLTNEEFQAKVKDTFQDEIADAAIRILDLCGCLDLDLEGHMLAKMKYNRSRPYKHGKQY